MREICPWCHGECDVNCILCEGNGFWDLGTDFLEKIEEKFPDITNDYDVFENVCIGWEKLIYNFLKGVVPIINNMPEKLRPKVVNIKERCGLLYVYFDKYRMRFYERQLKSITISEKFLPVSQDEKIIKEIYNLEKRSARTCTECGSRNAYRCRLKNGENGNKIRTLCDEHISKFNVKKEDLELLHISVND